MFEFTPSTNQRFTGVVTVQSGDQEVVIEASQFELAEAGTRSLGDGDVQYEELWVAQPALHEADADGGTLFERIEINVVRFNQGPFEFSGEPEIVYPTNNDMHLEDELELFDPDKQGPLADD